MDKGQENRLQDIGFYTLSDERAKNASKDSPLWRCELILTDRCNFRCPYCRGLRKDMTGELSFNDAMFTLKLWKASGLQNIRFSGGEPTLYPYLIDLVKYCKEREVNHIAVSTNGSADIEFYKELINAGINDFSVSLDSDCCSIGEKMTGGVQGSWDKVVKNIEQIAKLSYTTVGMVFTETNVDDAVKAITFADSLGVSDIRIISSAQYNQAIKNLEALPEEILNRHPILKYRVNNSRVGKPIRGMNENDSRKCRLVLDDMAAVNNYHFPCIIYLREGGNPIGKIEPFQYEMRNSRESWYKTHDSYADSICRENCLDVCVAYNNRAEELQEELCIKSIQSQI